MNNLTCGKVFLFLFVGWNTYGFRYGKVISPQGDPLNGLSYREFYLSIKGSGQFCELFYDAFGTFGFGAFGFGSFIAFFTRKRSRKDTSV